MQYDRFVNTVQDRGDLPDTDAALRAIEATLKTLTERVTANEAKDLKAQLPEEVKRYCVTNVDIPEKFDLDGFYARVAERENLDAPQAALHARAVIATIQDGVERGEIEDLKSQLPQEFNTLFEPLTGAR